MRRVDDRFLIDTYSVGKALQSKHEIDGLYWTVGAGATQDHYYTSVSIKNDPDAFTKIWYLFWKFEVDA